MEALAAATSSSIENKYGSKNAVLNLILLVTAPTGKPKPLGLDTASYRRASQLASSRRGLRRGERRRHPAALDLLLGLRRRLRLRRVRAPEEALQLIQPQAEHLHLEQPLPARRDRRPRLPRRRRARRRHLLQLAPHASRRPAALLLQRAARPFLTYARSGGSLPVQEQRRAARRRREHRRWLVELRRR